MGSTDQNVSAAPESGLDHAFLIPLWKGRFYSDIWLKLLLQWGDSQLHSSAPAVLPNCARKDHVWRRELCGPKLRTLLEQIKWLTLRPAAILER